MKLRNVGVLAAAAMIAVSACSNTPGGTPVASAGGGGTSQPAGSGGTGNGDTSKGTVNFAIELPLFDACPLPGGKVGVLDRKRLER